MATASFSLVSLAKALPCHNVGISSSSSCSLRGSRVPLPPSSAVPIMSYRPVKTVMMAKREQELEELRKLSDEELREGVVELKGEMVVLRMKKVAKQEIKSSEFQRMRKRIARMLTVFRERELEQGIKKRESRKLDRAWKRSVVVKPPPSLVALKNEKKEES